MKAHILLLVAVALIAGCSNDQEQAETPSSFKPMAEQNQPLNESPANYETKEEAVKGDPEFKSGYQQDADEFGGDRDKIKRPTLR